MEKCLNKNVYQVIGQETLNVMQQKEYGKFIDASAHLTVQEDIHPQINYRLGNTSL